MTEKQTIIDGKDYFICRKPGMSPITLYWSEYKNGKTKWSQKPGIAIKFVGGDKLRDFLTKNEGVFVMDVPANAAKKWRRR